MVALQKQAVYNVIIVLIAVLLFVVFTIELGLEKGQAGFGALGLLGFGPLFLAKRGSQVVLDERDAQVLQRATRTAFAVFWILFVGGPLAMYFLLIHEKSMTISIAVLPLLVWFGWVIFVFVHALAVLVQYRRLV